MAEPPDIWPTARAGSAVRHVSTSRPATRVAADLLVAAGDGPAEARARRRSRCREIWKVCSASTARAGLDDYLKGLVRYRAGDLAQSQPDADSAPARRLGTARHLRRQLERTCAAPRSSVGGGRARPADRLRQRRQSAPLARHDRAQRELSLRLSLGATRAAPRPPAADREPAAAVAGGALGIVVGYWGKQLLPPPVNQATILDWRVMGFVLAITVVTGIVFGIAPALRATGVNLNDVLKQGEPQRRRLAHRRSASRCSSCQVAISLVLLVGAGLFLRTLTNLRHVDVGFNPRNLLLFRINPQLNRYDEKRIDRALHAAARADLRRCRACARWRCRTRRCSPAASTRTSIFVRGRTYELGRRDSTTRSTAWSISPNFFETMEIPVVPGRGFNARDNETAPKVVVINEAAATEVFPERESDRPAFRIEHREQRPARSRRRAARCQVQQRARSGATDDVRAVPADASGQRGDAKCAPPAIRRA